VPLNIGATQRTTDPTVLGSAPAPASAPAPVPAPVPTSGSQSELIDEVVNELTRWGPREFIGAFQRWHHGAISLAHLNVVALLEGNGPMAMSRLAEAMDISVASATGVVDRMERRGLVERRHDADDRRVVLVHPTAGAGELFDAIDERRRRGLASVLDQLSRDDLEALLQGQRALREARERLRAAAQPSTDVTARA